jgi:hypothetical protein
MASAIGVLPQVTEPLAKLLASVPPAPDSCLGTWQRRGDPGARWEDWLGDHAGAETDRTRLTVSNIRGHIPNS